METIVLLLALWFPSGDWVVAQVRGFDTMQECQIEVNAYREVRWVDAASIHGAVCMVLETWA